MVVVVPVLVLVLGTLPGEITAGAVAVPDCVPSVEVVDVMRLSTAVVAGSRRTPHRLQRTGHVTFIVATLIMLLTSPASPYVQNVSASGVLHNSSVSTC